MSKIIFLILILFSMVQVYSQETKKKTERDSKNLTTEQYYVLKSNKSIKHGMYEKKVNGTLTEMGQYSNDSKIGVWTYYVNEDEIYYKYDYDNDIVSELKYDPMLSNVYLNDTVIKRVLDRPALFLGGKNEYLIIIAKNLRVPRESFESGHSGRVIVSIIVDEEGSAEDYYCPLIGFPPNDEEAIRVAKLIPNRYLPGLLDGKPVKTEFHVKVNFVFF